MFLQISSVSPVPLSPSSPALKSPRATRTISNFRSSPKSRKLDKGKARARTPSPIANPPPPFLDLEAEAISKAGINRRREAGRRDGVGPSGIGGSRSSWIGSKSLELEDGLGNAIRKTVPKEAEQSTVINDSLSFLPIGQTHLITQGGGSSTPRPQQKAFKLNHIRTDSAGEEISIPNILPSPTPLLPPSPVNSPHPISSPPSPHHLELSLQLSSDTDTDSTPFEDPFGVLAGIKKMKMEKQRKLRNGESVPQVGRYVSATEKRRAAARTFEAVEEEGEKSVKTMRGDTRSNAGETAEDETQSDRRKKRKFEEEEVEDNSFSLPPKKMVKTVASKDKSSTKPKKGLQKKNDPPLLTMDLVAMLPKPRRKKKVVKDAESETENDR
jgi:hypothetical protein